MQINLEDSRTEPEGLLPISCYIRTLDEERRIGEVLDSVKSLCSDVLLVDSGSKDRTLEIAEEKGARVVNQSWLGNGHQKRVGEREARFDWVLDIDADEVLSDELQGEIRELFSKGEPSQDGFWFRIVTISPFGEVWEKCCEVLRVKLYDRRKLQIPDHPAWDQFSISSEQNVGVLRGALWHHSFASCEHLVGKLNRVSSVRAQEKKIKPLWLLRLRIIFGFWMYLWRNVVWRGMWRGGLYSLVVAAISAGGRWLSDVKMYEIHRRKGSGQ